MQHNSAHSCVGAVVASHIENTEERPGAYHARSNALKGGGEGVVLQPLQLKASFEHNMILICATCSHLHDSEASACSAPFKNLKGQITETTQTEQQLSISCAVLFSVFLCYNTSLAESDVHNDRVVCI